MVQKKLIKECVNHDVLHVNHSVMAIFWVDKMADFVIVVYAAKTKMIFLVKFSFYSMFFFQFFSYKLGDIVTKLNSVCSQLKSNDVSIKACNASWVNTHSLNWGMLSSFLLTL